MAELHDNPRTPPSTDLTETFGSADCDAGMNRDRVGYAYETITAYAARFGTAVPNLADHDWDTNGGIELISDLITDLVHLAIYVGGDHDELVRVVERDIHAEAGHGYTI